VSQTTARIVVCSFCTREFEEDRGQAVCGSCLLNGGCRWMRCPHCGYENPESPQWVERLAAWVTDRAR
jgi:hypothetical protein